MNSLLHRNTLFWEGTDTVFRVFMAYLVLSRCGHAYSVDNWLRCRRLRKAGTLSGPDGPEPVYRRIPVWPRRLMMLQLAALYLVTGALKSGGVWQRGDAIYYALNLDHFHRVAAAAADGLARHHGTARRHVVRADRRDGVRPGIRRCRAPLRVRAVAAPALENRSRAGVDGPADRRDRPDHHRLAAQGPDPLAHGVAGARRRDRGHRDRMASRQGTVDASLAARSSRVADLGRAHHGRHLPADEHRAVPDGDARPQPRVPAR